MISLGDTAYAGSKDNISLSLPFCRYIGKMAFEDCVNLEVLDFSGYGRSKVPVLASPKAFTKRDTNTFVNDTFKILVPNSMYDEWISAPNWASLKNHIQGV